MYELPQASEVVVALGTLLAGTAALWAAYTAQKGLASWRLQKKWEQDADLSRRLLLTLRENIDGFRKLRAQIVSVSEMSAAVREFGISLEDRNKNAAYEAAIAARINTTVDKNRKIYSQLLEADILWNSDLETVFEKCMELQNSVIVAHKMVVEHQNDPNPSVEFTAVQRDYREKAFGRAGDRFDEEYFKLCSEISDFVKIKLGREI